MDLFPGPLAWSGEATVHLASLEFQWIAGIGGSPVYGIYRACASRGLRVLGTRTQAGATLMTAAAAFVAGTQSGAVVLSAGPAVTNAITGILVARDNGWPLLVLGGRRAVHGGQRGQFQELDAAGLIQPIAKPHGHPIWLMPSATPSSRWRVSRAEARLSPSPAVPQLDGDLQAAAHSETVISLVSLLRTSALRTDTENNPNPSCVVAVRNEWDVHQER